MNKQILRQKFLERRATSDERINSDSKYQLLARAGGAVQNFADAAVLIPIFQGEAELEVLFTRRAAHLKHHAGQVSFPGGRHETADASLEHTALRETQEETGIQRELVEVIGHLPRMYTISYYDVDPIVGLVRPGFELVPDRAEVDQIFSVPLAFFADSRHQKIVTREFWGQQFPMVEFHFEEHRIWGATAAMMVTLMEILWLSEHS